MRHIVFYDDNPDFGGHQAIGLKGIRAVARDPRFRVTLVLNPSNARLKAGAVAAEDEGVAIHETHHTTAKLQALRNHVNRQSRGEIQNQLTKLAPDLIVFLQGEIEDSSLALLAAQNAGLPTMSYIPVVHTMAEMGAKFGAIRDLTTRYLFRVPDSWLTISQSIADKLRSRGVRNPIHIAENGVDTGRFVPMDQEAVRASRGLPNGILLGICGRVEFNQKQQAFLVNAMARWSGRLASARLIIVGDGPDLPELRRQIDTLNLRERVIIREWEANPENLYPALDCLVIPSRFEGVPLVMLEAAACGVPVVGSDCDGMHDFLPEPWRFPRGDEAALAKAIEGAIDDADDLALQQRRKVLQHYSLQAFEKRFVDGIAAGLT